MELLKKIINTKNLSFYIFLLLSIIPLFFHKYFVSLDQPQHLYNANVLLEILKGNASINSYFKIDDIVVGYWSGHFFLALFLFFFPAWLAEKFFVISYIVAISFSFKYLVDSVNKKNNNLSILIFPFAYSMYFMMGYYSFSIAFIPLFLIISYLIRHPKLIIKDILYLGLLFLFLFLSHAFVFALTGIIIFLYFLFDFIFIKIRKDKFNSKLFFKNLLFVFFASLPAIIFFVIYMQYVMAIKSTIVETPYITRQLILFLFRIRQIVAFNHIREGVSTVPIFISLMLLFLSVIINYSEIKKEQLLNTIFSRKNISFAIALIFLFFYLLLPDQISAGSLTNRFGLTFFYIFIFALAIQDYKKIVIQITTFIIFCSFLYLQIYRTSQQISLNTVVEDIKTVEDNIIENKTVYTIRNSDLWLDPHFGCYIGTDKPIVNLNSPQNKGRFPIVWNFKETPVVKFENKVLLGRAPKHLPKSENNAKIDVDYVIFYNRKKNDIESKNIRDKITKKYNLIFKSPMGFSELYKLKK